MIKMKESVRLVFVLTFICLLASLGLALVNRATEQRIAHQKKMEKLSAIRSVLPPFDNDPIKDKKEFIVGKDEEGCPITKTFYLGKMNDKIVGVAFQAEGEGFGGTIMAIIGINLQGETTGIEILDHYETPGLGARIELSEFRGQFIGKSLANSKLVEGSLALMKDRGDIDSLTGATISSRGLTQAVDRALWLFKEHKDDILEK